MAVPYQHIDPPSLAHDSVCLDNRIRKRRDGPPYWHKWATPASQRVSLPDITFSNDDERQPLKSAPHLAEDAARHDPCWIPRGWVSSAAHVTAALYVSAYWYITFEPSDITAGGEPTNLGAVSRPIRAKKGAGPLQDFLLCVSFGFHVGKGSPASPRPAKS